MITLKFKTNINCGGCISKITPFLDNKSNIVDWQVDTANPQKVLTINTNNATSADIVSIVEKAGFMAEGLS